MIEIWKKIPEFETYEISDLGHVRRKLSRNLYKSVRCHKMTPGYICVLLSKSRKSVGRLVHRLVAEAYIPNDVDGWNVGHKDGNKENNQMSNLYWIQPKRKRSKKL